MVGSTTASCTSSTGGSAGWAGAGIEDHFEDGRFHDLFVRVTGAIVAQQQASFLASFAELGAPLPHDLGQFFPVADDPGSIDTTFLMNWPPGWLPVTDAAERLIEGARERLEIMNPYVGDRGMVDRIAAAAERGVTVRMVVPDAIHGNAVAYAAFQHHYDRLLAVGVAIWEYPALVHAKALVADDEVLVGTLNLDAWALYRNPEIALHIRDAGVAETFRRELFEVDIPASQAGAGAVGHARAPAQRRVGTDGAATLGRHGIRGRRRAPAHGAPFLRPNRWIEPCSSGSPPLRSGRRAPASARASGW